MKELLPLKSFHSERSQLYHARVSDKTVRICGDYNVQKIRFYVMQESKNIFRSSLEMVHFNSTKKLVMISNWVGCYFAKHYRRRREANRLCVTNPCSSRKELLSAGKLQRAITFGVENFSPEPVWS